MATSVELATIFLFSPLLTGEKHGIRQLAFLDMIRFARE
jgi:hypothetical protein